MDWRLAGGVCGLALSWRCVWAGTWLVVCVCGLVCGGGGECRAAGGGCVEGVVGGCVCVGWGVCGVVSVVGGVWGGAAG